MFFEIILRGYPTEWEIVFKELNHISFVTSAVTENQNFRDAKRQVFFT